MKNIKRKNLITFKYEKERRKFLIRFSTILFMLFFSLFFSIYKIYPNLLTSEANILRQANLNNITFEEKKYYKYGDFQVVDVTTNKIENLYTRGDLIKFFVTTTGTHGIIKIVTINKNIKFDKDYIVPKKGKNYYVVYGRAIRAGREYVSFVDGVNTKFIEVGILPLGDYIHGLMIQGPNKLAVNQKVDFNLFFVNILGHKEKIALKGDLLIYLMKNKKIIYQQKLKIKKPLFNRIINFNVKGIGPGKIDLVVSFDKRNRKYYSVKHLRIVE